MAAFTFLAPPALAASFPADTYLPSVSGDLRVGRTLTADPGSWPGAPTLSYRWQRCEVLDDPRSSVLGTTAANPIGVTVDTGENVYTADAGNKSVTRIGAPSSFGTGTFGPWGVTLDPQRNIFVTNTLVEARVAKLRPNGVPAGSPWPAATGTNGDAPHGIALDDEGNIYTANFGDDSVTKLLPDGTPAGSPWPVEVGGIGGQPWGIALGPDGSIFVSLRAAGKVAKITPLGVASLFGSTDSEPQGIAIDAEGNVYAGNNQSDTVTKLLPDGSSAGSPWPVQLPTTSDPSDLALDAEGNVYTANSFERVDPRPGTVSKISPDGSAVAGWPVEVGDKPQGIAVDSAGNVYTSNASSANVTKITQTDCESITGATGQTYTLTPVDLDRKIRVEVAAADAGSTTAFSIPTATVGPALSYDLTVSRSGTGSGTVTSAPSGINCGATCTASFTEETSVTLTASASQDSQFQGWSGSGCSDTGTCVVTMSEARNVTANFLEVPPDPPARTARIASVKVKGPAKVRRGKTARYKVTIRNSGNASATGVRLAISGRGLKLNTAVGSIAAGKARTVPIKVRFRKAGKLKATFRASATDAGSARDVRKIRVVR